MLFRTRASGMHLIISAAIALLAGVLVFGFWYPAPYQSLAGGMSLFAMLIGIDMVVGPALTALVASPAKPRAELRRDIGVIVVLQLLAFGYGMNTIAMARPANLVFEVDRFRTVSFADLDEADAKMMLQQIEHWSLRLPEVVGVRSALSPEENSLSMNASLQGVEPSQRPTWWQAYALSIPQVLARGRPVAELRVKHPGKAALFDKAIADVVTNVQTGETTDPSRLMWLPLVSRRALDWVAIVDPKTARVRGYLHVDGFD